MGPFVKPGVAAVIGNGVMGHGIAEVLAKAGWTVQLIGRSDASLERALSKIQTSLAEFESAGLIGTEESRVALGKISTSISLASAGEAQFVVEAIPELMDEKIEIFRELDKICAPTAILATSSGHPASSVDVGANRKERVIAAHFWYPPQLLPLVEVCGSLNTSRAVIDHTCQILRHAGKKPVVIDKEVSGFIGNRIQFAALREAWSLWAQGYATAEAIDEIVKSSIGRRLAITGPIESADIGGLETMYQFANFLQPDLNSEANPPEQIGALVREGHRGVATGKGVYDWADNASSKILDARRKELLRWMKIDIDEVKTRLPD